MTPVRAHQICTGLGAGNIGDELMARAFWQTLPGSIELEVGVLPEYTRQREPYPDKHTYVAVNWSGTECAGSSVASGLLVGGTPVSDAEGGQWPMQFLAPRLHSFHDRDRPVDAVGVGVDHDLTEACERLFREAFLAVRSWTVRSVACREALVARGVDPATVRVGADLAWLYEPVESLDDWAAAFWRRHQIDPHAPLLVVNVVNMIWQDLVEPKRALAAALDRLARRVNAQVAFVCNETRSGAFFDYAAAVEVAAFMRQPAVVVAPDYFSPAEMIALLKCATLTFSQRYHVVVESVLAGSLPVASIRGEKMANLAAELAIPAVGTPSTLDADELTCTIEHALSQRAEKVQQLACARPRMIERARGALTFLRELPPYCDADWPVP